jgi:hypothetical protein
MSATTQSSTPDSWWDDEVKVNGLLLGVAAATGAVSSFALDINPVETACLIGIPAAAVFRVAAEGVRGVAYLSRRLGNLFGGAGRAAAAEAVADAVRGAMELRCSATLADTGWRATAYSAPTPPTAFPVYARVTAAGDATVTRYDNGKLQSADGLPSITKIASDGRVTGAWYHDAGVLSDAWRPEAGPLDIEVAPSVLAAELDDAIRHAGDGLLAGQLLELLDRAEHLERAGVKSVAVRIAGGKLDVAALTDALAVDAQQRPAI